MKKLFAIFVLSILSNYVQGQVGGGVVKVVQAFQQAKKVTREIQKQTTEHVSSGMKTDATRNHRLDSIIRSAGRDIQPIELSPLKRAQREWQKKQARELQESFERMKGLRERFLAYVKIESQSIDEPSSTSFPMTEGQKEIARYIYEEVKGFGDENVKVTLSDDYYLYIDIPSNIKKDVPSILFMAHMDVSPEAPGKGINPIVHKRYDGGDIVLPAGITLSPNSPQGRHLKDLKGTTIITSDGSTLLGADDKTGCAVLITMVEDIVRHPDFKHGRVMVLLSQNEDVGKAAMRYDPNIFGNKPDIVIDVDGDTYNKFSIANFTAVGQTYYFKGNRAHPNDGKNNRLADALSAATYFMGQVPPELNPSAREGEEGYIHCYYLAHPLDSAGNEIASDYVVKARLRYFDNAEGEEQQKIMAENLRKVQEAFPFVESSMTDNGLQYQNIAYSMPDYVPLLIEAASTQANMPMKPKKSRGGTTSAMMAARYPDLMPGGSDVYSGQNAEHSCYEWCCVEEMNKIVDFTKHFITLVTVAKLKK